MAHQKRKHKPSNEKYEEKKEDSTPTRIGIDFGNVIRCDNGQPHHKSFEAIKLIVNKYGADNCYIVSKAKQDAQLKINNWLQEYEFFDVTGFSMYNVIFVRDYIGKKDIVDRFSINVFIDDKIQNIKTVITANSIIKVIWYNNNKNNSYSKNATKAIVTEISKKNYGCNYKLFRNRILISKDWNIVMGKNISKIPRRIPK
eukprot:428579_1